MTVTVEQRDISLATVSRLLELLPVVTDELVKADVPIPRWGSRLTPQERTALVGQVVTVLVRLGRAAGREETRALAEQIVDSMLGLGVLEPFLRDPEVNDITVRGNTIRVRRAGQRDHVGEVASREYFSGLAERVAGFAGQTLSAANPMVVVALPDGSRLTIITEDVSQNGTVMAVRRFSQRKLSLNDLVENGTISPDGAGLLKRLAGRATILFCGPPGAGKTTLMNATTAHVDPRLELAVVETFREVQPQHPCPTHLVIEPGRRAEDQRDPVDLAKAVNVILTRTLVDCIVVGEIVAREAVDWLAAASLGIAAMATIHAHHPIGALLRLEERVLTHESQPNPLALRLRIAQAVDLIVQCQRTLDGVFRVEEIAEVLDLDEHGHYQLRTLQKYDWDAQVFTPLDPPVRIRERVR